MKKILFLLLLSINSYAQTVHRVTNGMNLQTVIDNAVNGDMILVEGGNYGDITINKALRIYGTGYLLDVTALNSNFQMSVSTSIVNSILFSIEGSNSELHGISTNNIQILGSQISIYRTKFNGLTIGTSTILSNNILVKQSLLSTFSVNANSTNIAFYNNIIKGDGDLKSPITITFINNSFINGNKILDVQGNTGVYKNNIFFPEFRFRECYGASWFNFYNNSQNTIYNNIFGVQTANAGGNCSLSILNIDVNVTNKVSQDYSLIYLSPAVELKEDARYQLAPNSPAKGAGENGTDCGAFGGDDPYVLSGIPSIPSIYQLTVPSQVPQNGTLNIQIKAKTNN